MAAGRSRSTSVTSSTRWAWTPRDVLRCKTAHGVMKELLAYAIVYNLVCLVMHEAARRQGVVPRRISFVDTLRWLIHHDAQAALAELVINPERPGRVQPRAVKRRPKEYDLLNQPRPVPWAQLLTAARLRLNFVAFAPVPLSTARLCCFNCCSA